MVEKSIPIDPTKNVLDLVAAQEKLRDALRTADQRYDDALRLAAEELATAETRRIDQLASQRVYYDAIIEAMRSDSLKLLAEQLKENKAESSSRMGLLEQFRWETGGKTAGISMAGALIIGVSMVVSAVIAVVGFAAPFLRHAPG